MGHKIRLVVLPICGGPASGKKATVVYSGKKKLGFIQPVSVQDPVGGGMCCPHLFIAVQSVGNFSQKVCDCFDDALRFFGIGRDVTDNLTYPEGIFDEYFV